MIAGMSEVAVREFICEDCGTQVYSLNDRSSVNACMTCRWIREAGDLPVTMIAKLRQHEALRQSVHEALVAARANGYTLAGWNAEQIAEDMQRYCAAVDALVPRVFLPYVREWMDTHRGERNGE